MKILVLFLLLSNLTWGQVTYTSPLTQHWPTLFTTEFEEVDRPIWFYPDEVVLITGTKEGKEIQTLLVKDVDYSEQEMTTLYLKIVRQQQLWCHIRKEWKSLIFTSLHQRQEK